MVLTSIEPRGTTPAKRGAAYDAYEYVAHSHTYLADGSPPSAKVTYDLSPIQVVVREKPRAWYHFLTTTCAIIGGVFTVAGIIDSLLYTGLRMARNLRGPATA